MGTRPRCNTLRMWRRGFEFLAVMAFMCSVPFQGYFEGQAQVPCGMKQILILAHRHKVVVSGACLSENTYEVPSTSQRLSFIQFSEDQEQVFLVL